MEQFPQENTENNNESLNSQEKIDEQIIEEAGLLKVNMQSLQEEIQAAGGLEKVKSHLDQKYLPSIHSDYSPRNIGEQIVVEERSSAENSKMAKKIMGTFALIFSVIAAWNAAENPAVFEQMKDMDFTAGNAATGEVVNILGALFTGGPAIIAAINEKIANRKAKREYIKAKIVGSQMNEHPSY